MNLPNLDPGALSPVQAEAYQEVSRWRGMARFTRAADLLDYIAGMPAGATVHRRQLIHRVRSLDAASFDGAIRDARTVAAMTTGLAPQVAIPHLGGGLYGPPTEGDLLAWVRTRARSIRSQTQTVARVTSAYADTHPTAGPDVDVALTEAERLRRGARRFARRIGA